MRKKISIKMKDKLIKISINKKLQYLLGDSITLIKIRVKMRQQEQLIMMVNKLKNI